jgi:hypothetical protein
MNLPNYFLADLPPEAELGPAMIAEACLSLKRNRELYLASRSTHSLIKTLCRVAENWRDSEYPFRKLALAQGPAATGFSAGTLAAGLDAFFAQLTPHNFEALLEQDLGHHHRLEQLVATHTEQKGNRAAIATAPELLAHIAAGNLPVPTLMSIVLGVLVRSAQFVKCASGAALIPRLFAHSLYEADAKLGACLEIAVWPSKAEYLTGALFAEADCVTATGSDETLAAVRQRLPARARFLGYGHRVSFAYITGQVLTALNSHKIVERAANDVSAWNQLGCLSPHVVYVESGGKLSAEQFAEALAGEMERREAEEPRGPLSLEEAAAIRSRRAIYEIRSVHSPDTRHWASHNSTAWTVVYEADPRFQHSCLNRFIYVKSVGNLGEALQNADGVKGKVSTVGLAATEDRVPELATELARWGVTRVCPLGQMQHPPLTWRHDGRPSLGDLITWTDCELT